MTIVKRAMCWAVAIFVVAFAKRSGLIGPRTGELMLLVLPVVATLTMFGMHGGCAREREA